MKKLNPDHVEAILKLINQGPYFQLLSIDVIELGWQYCKLVVQLDKKHLNPFGGLHGGVHASLIDTAAYWASYCALPEDVGLISVDLTVNNLSTTNAGKLIVEGTGIKSGRSICFSQATVTDDSGKLLAHGFSKQMVTNGLQSIDQAVLAMGHPALPPKFILET